MDVLDSVMNEFQLLNLEQKQAVDDTTDINAKLEKSISFIGNQVESKDFGD